MDWFKIGKGVCQACILSPWLFNFCAKLFSYSVVFNSLQCYGLQHTRLSHPSVSPGGYSTYIHWVNDAIQPSHPLSPLFFSCPQSFPASESFPMSQLFTSGGQRIGASAPGSDLQMNMQGWFPLGMTGWIFLKSKGLSRVFSNTPGQKHQFFSVQPSFWSNSHIHTGLLEKP